MRTGKVMAPLDKSHGTVFSVILTGSEAHINACRITDTVTIFTFSDELTASFSSRQCTATQRSSNESSVSRSGRSSFVQHFFTTEANTILNHTQKWHLFIPTKWIIYVYIKLLLFLHYIRRRCYGGSGLFVFMAPINSTVRGYHEILWAFWLHLLFYGSI